MLEAAVDEYPSTIGWADPRELEGHPFSLEVYGCDSHGDLVEGIRESGVREPIHVSTRTGNLVVVSGHRRRRAAIEAGCEHVPIIPHKYETELEEQLAIIEFNRQRVKTGLQFYKEGKARLRIEAERARTRQGTRTDLQPNFPQNFGESSERHEREADAQVAQAIGLGSGEQWRKLEYVAERMPELLPRIGLGGISLHRAYTESRMKAPQSPKSPTPLSYPPLPTSIQVYHEDARHLKRYVSDSAALCITSPPYNCGAPYQNYQDNLAWEEWDALLREVFSQVHDVLVPGGRLALNLPLHRTRRQGGDFPAMRAWSLLLSLNYEPLDALIWSKARNREELQGLVAPLTSWGSWCSPKQPYLRSAIEVVWIFQKQGDFQSNGAHTDLTAEEFKEWTVNIWHIPPIQNSAHPATFPKELPRRLIKLYTYPGQIVLDPFMGIGTTGEAALETGRNFIGFEISQLYIEIARQRFAQHRGHR
ncbi:MAG: DNA modification methylase [Chloroflexota bacterium]